ncbi:hypothetical protein ACT3TC_06900 [Halomonas sp. AOP27-A1-41]|uniref:hypothetical protein n=1 Tax=Halomonas sp. AOP27-A1-41 TaxID=3457707 RepID=UPI00403408DC
MMSKELLKKAGILGVTFGLLASPFAFAQEPVDPSHDITADEEPVQPQSSGTGAGGDASTYEADDLSDMNGESAGDTTRPGVGSSQHETHNESMDGGPTGVTGGGDTSFEPSDLPEQNSSVTTGQDQ